MKLQGWEAELHQSTLIAFPFSLQPTTDSTYFGTGRLLAGMMP
jgi:hypothetical protein